MKNFKYLILLVGIMLFITGCSSTYKIEKTKFDDIEIYVEETGTKYLNYVNNDSSLSKRDKNTLKTKHLYVLDIIKNVKTQ